MDIIVRLLGSKTVWGAILTLLANILALKGVHVGTGDLQTAYNDLINAVQILAPIWTIFGRSVASGPIVQSATKS